MHGTMRHRQPAKAGCVGAPVLLNYNQKILYSMKKIQLLILTLFITFSYVQSQECCLKQYLGEDYEIDVKHLALLRMEQFDVPQQDEVIIDQLWQDTIWEGLTAIFYSDSYGRDQVFDEYCLHHRYWNLEDFQRISQRMYIKPDPDVSWFQNWANGDITTNNLVIDSLLSKYGFETITFPFVFSGTFEIKTNQNLNLVALATELLLNDSIILAERNNPVGGNQRIIYREVDGLRYFDFMVGWGDCPSGCQSWHTWSFVVTENCDVDYIGSFGSTDIPGFYSLNCNLSDSITYSPPAVTFNLLNNTYCLEDESFQLTGGDPPGGQFSGNGVTNNIFYPTEAGIGQHHITYTIVDSSFCSQDLEAMDDIYVLADGCTTNLNQLENNELTIKVNPNPSDGNLMINLEGFNDRNIKFKIINIDGSTISSGIYNNEYLILRGLNNGIYIIEITNGETKHYEKIIVN